MHNFEKVFETNPEVNKRLRNPRNQFVNRLICNCFKILQRRTQTNIVNGTLGEKWNAASNKLYFFKIIAQFNNRYKNNSYINIGLWQRRLKTLIARHAVPQLQNLTKSTNTRTGHGTHRKQSLLQRTSQFPKSCKNFSKLNFLIKENTFTFEKHIKL